MASCLQTKPLNELSEDEVAALLVEIKFGNIKEKLFSGNFGEINGEMIKKLKDKDLKSEFGISSGLQRKNFINKMKTYKEEGVPLKMLPANIHPQTPVDRSLLEKLLKKSEKIKHECTPGMDILAFPSKKVRVSELKRPTQGKNLRKIIIMGETGTGKSTLLNAFVNFAAGIEMEDPFRFKLVVDESGQSHDQTKSQTTEISGYLIEDTELGFPLQIWDTPGFGDTSGVERDEKLKEQINELLKIEDECHAICFVVKANVNRLTDIQKYIIDRVLLFFGKEALENIYILATFADANRPQALSAIEKSSLPFDENCWFAFNNADLFKTASERTSLTKSYWDIVNFSFAKFFRTLKHLLAFSLTSTKSVIKEREKHKMNISSNRSDNDKAIGITDSCDVATQNTKTNSLLHCEPIKLSDAKPGSETVKQIILLGETGNGKSSLINSIANVMFGIEQEREFRFKVIENEIQTGKSLTNSIQGYKIESKYSSYSYIFWDTPGFFHTDGFESDIQLAQDFSKLLLAIESVEAIVIVEKSSDIIKKGSSEKLQQRKNYLFNQMLSNFGEDAIPHTYLFLTFPSSCDEKVPSLSQYSYPFNIDQVYIVNNSIMFEKETTNKEISKMVWDNNVFNFRHFIDKIHSNGRLNLKTATIPILKYKTELKQDCNRLVEKIKELQTNCKEYEKSKKSSEQNIKTRDANENYTYEVKVSKKISIPTKRNTVYCNICFHTCHADCIEMGKQKSELKKCEAFDKSDSCQICPKKCQTKHHSNHPYIIEEQEITEKKTDEKMKQTFEQANNDNELLEKKIQSCDEKFEQLTDEAMTCIMDVMTSLEKVIKLAPYYSPNSTYDYLNQVKEQNKSIQKLFSMEIIHQFILQYIIQTVNESKAKITKLMKQEEAKTYYNTLLETLKEEITLLDKEFGGTMI